MTGRIGSRQETRYADPSLVAEGREKRVNKSRLPVIGIFQNIFHAKVFFDISESAVSPRDEDISWSIVLADRLGYAFGLFARTVGVDFEAEIFG